MSDYIKTNTILDKILEQKRREIVALMADEGYHDGFASWVAQIAHYASEAAPPRDFMGVLAARDRVALIAEVKKASPSKGVLIADFDPVRLGTIYADHGAAAISVLTDEQFFQGHLRYLRQVHDAVSVPLLRKDFIIDPYQVIEARASCADGVLLIVAALDDDKLADLHAQIREWNMAALVEVHNEAEMERALKLGAKLIGVNNRDLKTFDVDLATTGRLAAMVPDDVILVAESGIRNVDDVAQMGQLGARAVLVGESLVKAGDDLAGTVWAFSNQKIEKDQA